MEKAKTRDGGRELLYTFCSPAAHAFLPLRSIQAHADSAGQAGFASHKPLRFRPSGLQIPPVLASPKGPCAAPSQAPSVAARRRRYNTLDLASKIVCQGRPCPLWIPLPRNPGFFGFFQPAGSFPLWTPLAKEAPPPLKSPANETKSVSSDSSSQRKTEMNDHRSFHFSLPKGPHPL